MQSRCKYADHSLLPQCLAVIWQMSCAQWREYSKTFSLIFPGRWHRFPPNKDRGSQVQSMMAEQGGCLFLDVNYNSTQYLFIGHIVTLVLNSFSFLTAVAGNAVVILVVWKTPALHTPSNVFLCCLAISDLTVGLIAQPCFVIHKIGELLQNHSMYCTTRILSESVGYITTGTSVLIMTGIAIERYLALYLHLRYKQIITTKRILAATFCLWVFFILLAVSRFWIANDSIFNNIPIPVIGCSLVFTFLAYMKVLKYVRRHENQIHDQNISSPDQHPAKNRLLGIKRYKKSTLTMAYIVGIFVLCYIPILCVKIAHKIEGYTSSVQTAYVYATTIVFLNSSFNPVVYCWRMTDIRRAVKGIFSRCLWEKELPGVETPQASKRLSEIFRGDRALRMSNFNTTGASHSVIQPCWNFPGCLPKKQKNKTDWNLAKFQRDYVIVLSIFFSFCSVF